MQYLVRGLRKPPQTAGAAMAVFLRMGVSIISSHRKIKLER
jgi:hypothetical protein